jgi:hypothetical protein
MNGRAGLKSKGERKLILGCRLFYAFLPSCVHNYGEVSLHTSKCVIQFSGTESLHAGQRHIPKRKYLGDKRIERLDKKKSNTIRRANHAIHGVTSLGNSG